MYDPNVPTTTTQIPDWVKYAAVGAAAFVIGMLFGKNDNDKQVVIVGGKRFIEE